MSAQNVRIYIINGPAGVGKDTFVEMTTPSFREKGYSVKNISTVDNVKAALKLLGWDGVTKDAKTRQALSDLKDISTAYNDGPASYCYNVAEKLAEDGYHKALFIHCREPKEIEKMALEFKRRSFEVMTIAVKRDGIETFNNHADSNALNYAYDWTIDNNADLEHLKYLSEHFVDIIV
jgi:hypothetical protein